MSTFLLTGTMQFMRQYGDGAGWAEAFVDEHFSAENEELAIKEAENIIERLRQECKSECGFDVRLEHTAPLVKRFIIKPRQEN